jgi:glycine/D-amino acid oxidase-like deaminating enzyme
MVDTVEEVGRVAAAEGIDCGYAKGGTLTLATSRAHVARVREHVRHDQAWGLPDTRWLDAADVGERVAASGVLGAAYTPHCARLHPARLVRGLASAVERRGVTIHEQTRVSAIEPRTARTEHGTVRARTVLRATEGYTATLAGERRTMVPVYSLIIATEPLPPEVWDEVRLSARETFADHRHLIVYGQRTADDRLAFGGRGAPYHYASSVRREHDREPATFAALHRVLVDLLPAVEGAALTHSWGGPLGIARDWCASVGLDPATGLAWAGGYVGDGVATTNLAGRTLTDLVLCRDTGLTALPWVNHRSRRWEPEPLRWLGVSASLTVMAGADTEEVRTGRPSRRAAALNRLLGR